MGCSASRLQDAEAVQLCKDRKNFIKQALEQRSKFASGHIAYIESLKRVSMALNRFINGDYKQELLLPFDPYVTPPLVSKKRPSLEIRTLDPGKRNFHVAKYLRSGGHTSISVQERPPPVQTLRVESHFAMESGSANLLTKASPIDPVKQDFGEVRYMRSSIHAPVTVQERHQPTEAIRMESYFPMETNYGIDGYFDGSSYTHMASSSYDNGSGVNSYPTPRSPENSRWDSFWNPFTSLDNNTYPNPSYSGYDRNVSDDDAANLQRVREQEGIPELEEDINSVELESAEESDEEEDDMIEDETEGEFDFRINNQDSSGFKQAKLGGVCNGTTCNSNIKQDMKGFQNKGMDSVEVIADASRGIDVELKGREKEKNDLVRNSKKEIEDSKPGFTVYINRRPLCLAEVMTEIELQFERASDAAHEITGLLEAGQVIFNQLCSTPSDLAAKILNPVALFRSGSSRTSSSRFFLGSTSSREDAFDTGSCFSDDSSLIPSSHQSTLDRLYVWEKKLYHEVKAGEKIRIEYEKKLNQLKNQDVTGVEPLSVDKTRAALQNLHTRLKVSFHSVQSVSRRIETLRDEELYPQLMDLLQGLERMWRAMSECHQIQKRTIDEAKHLIFSSDASFFGATLDPAMSIPAHVGPAAEALEAELKMWRRAFWGWVSAQQAYASALLGWAQRCCGSREEDIREEKMAGCGEQEASRMWRACWRWARGVEGVSGAQVMDGLDFFAAGMGSVYAGLAERRKEDEEVNNISNHKNEDMVQMAGRVVFAGLSVAVSALGEYAAESGGSYGEVVRRCRCKCKSKSKEACTCTCTDHAESDAGSGRGRSYNCN